MLSLAYGIPVPILQTVIDSKHFAELIAYDNIEGISRPVREAGTIASTVANAMSSGGKQFDGRDFMPVRRQRKAGMTFAALAKRMTK